VKSQSQFVQGSSLHTEQQEQQAPLFAPAPANLQGNLSSLSPLSSSPASSIPTPVTPPHTTPAVKKNGLLSSGRYTNTPSPQGVVFAPAVPIAPPQAPQGPAWRPITEPARQAPGGPGPYAPQAWPPDAVSPHQSGLSPLASLTVGSLVQQAPPAPSQPVAPPQQAPAWAAAPPRNANAAWPSFVGAGQQPNGAWQPLPLPRPLPTSTPLPPLRSRRKRFPTWARVAVAVCAVMFILIGTGIGYYQATFAGHISNITGQKAATITIRDKDGSTQSSALAGSTSIGTNRINILLLGSDDDSKFSAPLAQTDIVVTIDPQTNYVGMLSIPRDLWLNVPGIGMHKLDEAFAEGWQYVHQGPTPFSNAVGLSILTIEQDFGIHIDHYAWVGLDGFIQVINTAGGVDINVTHPMVDDTYPNDIQTANAYSYKRLYIAPGPQHMDGLHALEYVRTRHSDLVGDFGRSARQQQVLSQLKTKLDTPNIISELPQLAQELDGSVKTDMDIQTLVSLMNYARNLDPNKVDHVVLSPPYSSSYTAPNGEDAFLPICSQITPVIAKMFALGTNAVCNVTANSDATPTLAAAMPSMATQSFSGNALSALQQPGSPASVGLTSLSNGLSNSTNDPFGLRSMLDMMFMVVFGSFDATKV
jgi:LCP family protein required for cell wall assembly